MFSLSSQGMGRTFVFMFDPLPEIPDDDVDSFVSLSEAAKGVFERLAAMGRPILQERCVRTDPARRCPVASDQSNESAS